MFSKLAYTMIKKMGNKDMYSVNIDRKLPILGMSTYVFKISLCYDSGK